MAGTRDKLKGKIKQATGILIGDKGLEREGKVDHAVGTLKGVAEKVVSKARGAVAPLKRRARKATKSLR